MLHLDRRDTTASLRSPLLAAALLALPGCASAPDGASERTGEAASEIPVCADGPTVEGIDVSFWQQDVDWQAVKDSGIGFGIARVSYGVSKDTYFDANWAGMKSVDLVRGGYQFYLADQDPIAQAELMVEALGQLGQGDFAPVLDIETTEGQSAATIIDGMKQWLGHVEAATGRKPIIYTGKYFWQDNIASSDFSAYPLWIPNYSFDCPNLPDGYWDDWELFQYTDSGSVPGVSGNVDRNRFNGTMEDLVRFAGGGFAAEFVAQSFPYTSEGSLQMRAGDVVEAWIELRNAGARPWDSNTMLAATEPRDRESVFAGPEWPAPNRYAQVEGVVNPGETYRFTFQLHAPMEPGLYDEFFGVVQEGEAWFSDQGGPPDNQLEGLFEVLAADQVPVNPPADPTDPGLDSTSGEGDADQGNLCAARPGPAGRGGWFLLGLGLIAAARRRRPSMRPLA